MFPGKVVLLILSHCAKLLIYQYDILFMFDEEKTKRDLEKMREAYAKAKKSLAAVKERQSQIAEMILKYKARNKNISENQWA